MKHSLTVLFLCAVCWLFQGCSTTTVTKPSLIESKPREATVADLAMWAHHAAELGVGAVEIYDLGRMYEFGRGVAKNDAEAVKWYRKAAEQGFARAQLNLGRMYFEGLGVAKDFAVAYKWFLLAGARGDERAQKAIPLIEGLLTPSQQAEGQRLAREWKPQGKKP